VVRMSAHPDGVHPAHLYWMTMPSDAHQAGLIAHLRERDIVAAFHYQALDESAAGQRLARTPRPCTVSRAASHRLVRLPLHAELSESDVERVLEGVTSYQVDA